MLLLSLQAREFFPCLLVVWIKFKCTSVRLAGSVFVSESFSCKTEVEVGESEGIVNRNGLLEGLSRLYELAFLEKEDPKIEMSIPIVRARKDCATVEFHCFLDETFLEGDLSEVEKRCGVWANREGSVIVFERCFYVAMFEGYAPEIIPGNMGIWIVPSDVPEECFGVVPNVGLAIGEEGEKEKNGENSFAT